MEKLFTMMTQGLVQKKCCQKFAVAEIILGGPRLAGLLGHMRRWRFAGSRYGMSAVRRSGVVRNDFASLTAPLRAARSRRLQRCEVQT